LVLFSGGLLKGLQNGHVIPHDSPLILSLFLDGSGHDEGIAVDVDSFGNIYVVGSTDSLDFPIVNGFNSTNNGEIDCFIAKVDSSNGQILFSTYLGGIKDDLPTDIELDSSDNIYITGKTESPDFPDTWSTSGPAPNHTSIFVAKIDGSSFKLVYSVVMGGSGNDVSRSIAIDHEEDAYIVGRTSSPDFELLNGSSSAFGGGEDAFIAKINSTGFPCQGSYLSGSRTEDCYDIFIRDSQAIWVTGTTDSEDFLGQSFHPSNLDGFIVLLNTSTLSTVDVSLFGGSGNDIPSKLVIDKGNLAYISGTTTSPDFPIVNAVDSHLDGIRDSFILGLSLNSSAISFSSYIGGSAIDESKSMDIDEAGSIYISGFTTSADFPLEDPIVTEHQGGVYDAFITKLSFDRSQLGYSTYIGGSQREIINAIRLDKESNLIVAGFTTSPDFRPAMNVTLTYHGEIGSACFILVLSDLTDSDDDMLRDVVEKELGTNPNSSDTDSDGFSDYWEVVNGFDPLDSQPNIGEYILYHSSVIIIVIAGVSGFVLTFLYRKAILKTARQIRSLSYYWRGRFGVFLLVISLLALPIGVRYHILSDELTLYLDFFFPVIFQVSSSGWEVMAPYSVLGIMNPILVILIVLLVGYSVISVQKKQRIGMFLGCLIIYSILDFLVFFPNFSPYGGSIPLPIALFSGLFLYRFGLPKETDAIFENDVGKPI
jgi:hypothetical protein